MKFQPIFPDTYQDRYLIPSIFSQVTAEGLVITWCKQLALGTWRKHDYAMDAFEDLGSCFWLMCTYASSACRL